MGLHVPQMLDHHHWAFSMIQDVQIVVWTQLTLFSSLVNLVIYIAGLRVILPNGAQEVLSQGDNDKGPESVTLVSDGFIAVSVNIMSVMDKIVSLTISITNASLLDGGEIICDDTTPWNKVMAGCPVCGKF